MTEQDRQTLFHLSTLLRYPDEDLLLFLRDVRDGRHMPEAGIHPHVDAFIHRAAQTEILDLQSEYVRTFDLQTAASLHLTWHVYGDSPRQGRALAALLEIYRDADFHPLPGELPDYLPMMLEFMAAGPEWAAACLQEKFGSVVATLAAQVADSGSTYAPLLHAAADVMTGPAPLPQEVSA